MEARSAGLGQVHPDPDEDSTVVAPDLLAYVRVFRDRCLRLRLSDTHDRVRVALLEDDESLIRTLNDGSLRCVPSVTSGSCIA